MSFPSQNPSDPVKPLNDFRPEDQRRVVAAVKAGRIPDEDIYEALVAPPALPTGLTLSPAAKAIPAAQWPPSKPSGPSAFAKRMSRKGESKKGSTPTGSGSICEASPSFIASVSAPGPSSSSKPDGSGIPAKRGYLTTDPSNSLVGDEDEEEEDSEPEQEEDVFYLRYHTEVVGIQYYRGLVGTGETVNLVGQNDYKGLQRFDEVQ